MNRLLVFLGEAPGWLRLAEGRIVARGDAPESIPPGDEDDPERVVLVVPGSEVAVHWVELPPDLAPAQARGAARLLASEVSAQPLDAVHVALGPLLEGETERCMALVAEERMRHWLEEAQAIGCDPDAVVPEPLLVLPPEAGVRVFKRAGLDNVRGIRRAFAAEPEIAALLVGEEPIETCDAEAFEAGIPAALAALPVDLRQGAFAKRRRWTIDWANIRRLAALAAGILLVTLLIQLVMIAHYSFAAAAVEHETRELAREVLPGDAEIADPAAQLDERFRTMGGGPGYGAIAGAVFTAVRDTGGAELQSLVYRADGSLAISVATPGDAELAAFQQRLSGAGLAVEPGAVRDAGGRRIGDFTVRAP